MPQACDPTQEEARQGENSLLGRVVRSVEVPFYLWTLEAVSREIKKQTGIELSVWTMGWGLKYSLPPSWGRVPRVSC